MWIVPSRGRPHNIPRLGSGDFILMLDDDDPMLGGYTVPKGWRVRVGPRAPLSKIYNRVFEEFPDLPWYGIFADDVTPETDSWDSKLIAAAKPNRMAYPDDGIGAPTHFCLGGDLVREIGWLALPGLSRLYIDTVWKDIAESRGVLRYLPEVKVLHRHPSVGLALMDKTYRKNDKLKDKALYQQFRGSL